MVSNPSPPILGGKPTENQSALVKVESAACV